jgi:CheY-like chemotaxis protein
MRILLEPPSSRGVCCVSVSRLERGIAPAADWTNRRLPVDFMMPYLAATGFVALKRRNPRFERVPVLLMTAALGAIEAGQSLGAHACLSKPFELDDLAVMVARLVSSSDQPTLPTSDGGGCQASSSGRTVTSGLHR